MSKHGKAPWTDDQVASLNAYQACDQHHPFTCGEREPDGSPHVLQACSNGWFCPKCVAVGKSYRQDWCHDWMANWTWKRV